jgi:hypothetical protein
MQASTDTTASPSALDLLAAAVDLTSVQTVSFAAKRHSSQDIDHLGIQVGISFGRHGDLLLYKLRVHCDLFAVPEPAEQPTEDEPSTDGPVVADLDLDLLLELSTPTGFEVPDSEVLSEFGGKVIHRLAFPYIRESVSAMLARLGFPPVTFGMLRDGQTWPQGAGATAIA